MKDHIEHTRKLMDSLSESLNEGPFLDIITKPEYLPIMTAIAAYAGMGTGNVIGSVYDRIRFMIQDKKDVKNIKKIVDRLSKDPEFIPYLDDPRKRGIMKVMDSKLKSDEKKYLKQMTRRDFGVAQNDRKGDFSKRMSANQSTTENNQIPDKKADEQRLERFRKIIRKEVMQNLKDGNYNRDIVRSLFESGKKLTEDKDKNVKLNKPFRTQGGPKKFSVYVKNDKGNVVKVNFGDPDMEIKRDDEERRDAFRARHNCADKTDKTTPGYWSCKMWQDKKSVGDMMTEGQKKVMVSAKDMPAAVRLFNRGDYNGDIGKNSFIFNDDKTLSNFVSRLRKSLLSAKVVNMNESYGTNK